MRSGKGTAIIVLGLVASAILVGALSTLTSATTSGNPTGDDLAREMGLTPHYSNEITGCGYVVEVDDHWYCLDGVVSNNIELRAMAMRLQENREPTAEDLRRFELLEEAAGLSSDDPQVIARFVRIVTEIRRLAGS